MKDAERLALLKIDLQLMTNAFDDYLLALLGAAREMIAREGARLTESAVVEGPCAFFAVGAPGRFDNHIHRITCLSDTGHSLHVYSDDALRGEVYREE